MNVNTGHLTRLIFMVLHFCSRQNQMYSVTVWCEQGRNAVISNIDLLYYIYELWIFKWGHLVMLRSLIMNNKLKSYWAKFRYLFVHTFTQVDAVWSNLISYLRFNGHKCAFSQANLTFHNFLNYDKYQILVKQYIKPAITKHYTYRQYSYLKKYCNFLT